MDKPVRSPSPARSNGTHAPGPARSALHHLPDRPAPSRHLPGATRPGAVRASAADAFVVRRTVRPCSWARRPARNMRARRGALDFLVAVRAAVAAARRWSAAAAGVPGRRAGVPDAPGHLDPAAHRAQRSAGVASRGLLQRGRLHPPPPPRPVPRWWPRPARQRRPATSTAPSTGTRPGGSGLPASTSLATSTILTRVDLAALRRRSNAVRGWIPSRSISTPLACSIRMRWSSATCSCRASRPLASAVTAAPGSVASARHRLAAR